MPSENDLNTASSSSLIQGHEKFNPRPLELPSGTPIRQCSSVSIATTWCGSLEALSAVYLPEKHDFLRSSKCSSIEISNKICDTHDGRVGKDRVGTLRVPVFKDALNNGQDFYFERKNGSGYGIGVATAGSSPSGKQKAADVVEYASVYASTPTDSPASTTYAPPARSKVSHASKL
ncbi:hypothetical protein Micbo1qcDRAFT_181026 [Microdochium bolleyi]|uniref:Uncharacterized protein n=1 Tax=Microdochium bolleyi TaxID=196109 RepID=A0A136IJR1_9PEZI|nr:hypothetical protein Micbo1qcDRAFT_181026 [Microdochium bolleyi]